jgi:hypothetical protein
MLCVFDLFSRNALASGFWKFHPHRVHQAVDLTLTRSVSEGLFLKTRQKLSLTHVSGWESPLNQQSHKASWGAFEAQLKAQLRITTATCIGASGWFQERPRSHRITQSPTILHRAKPTVLAVRNGGTTMEQAISKTVPAISRLREPIKMLPGFSNQQDSLVFSISEGLHVDRRRISIAEINPFTNFARNL